MMRCHSPDVNSCPIVLAVQDNGACVIIDRWLRARTTFVIKLTNIIVILGHFPGAT